MSNSVSGPPFTRHAVNTSLYA